MKTSGTSYPKNFLHEEHEPAPSWQNRCTPIWWNKLVEKQRQPLDWLLFVENRWHTSFHIISSESVALSTTQTGSSDQRSALPTGDAFLVWRPATAPKIRAAKAVSFRRVHLAQVSSPILSPEHSDPLDAVNTVRRTVGRRGLTTSLPTRPGGRSVGSERRSQRLEITTGFF